jgi:hypothetical protein
MTVILIALGIFIGTIVLIKINRNKKKAEIIKERLLNISGQRKEDIAAIDNSVPLGAYLLYDSVIDVDSHHSCDSGSSFDSSSSCSDSCGCD